MLVNRCSFASEWCSGARMPPPHGARHTAGTARPTVTPAMVVSSNGVSSTRSSPNFSCRPWVARNTPPLTPTSSPSTTTRSSSLIARASARLMPPIRVVSGMVASPGCRDLLLGIGRRQDRIEMVEHRFRRHWRRRQIALDRSIDLAVDLVDQPLFGILGPGAGGAEVAAQAGDRVLGPLAADFPGLAG